MGILNEEIKRINRLLNYKLGKPLNEQEGSNPKNPDVYPDQDEFGFDDAWSWDEWKIYFDAMSKKFGVLEAKKRFLKYWEVVEEGTFVKADNDMEQSWFEELKMWNYKANRPYTKLEFEKTIPKEVVTKPTGVSNKIIEFIKKHEFFVPCVYDDKNSIGCIRGEMKRCCLRGRKPRGISTIGYGTVYYPNGKRVKSSDPDVSKETAEKYLVTKVQDIASHLLKLHPNLNQNQLDALTSLCYNTGITGCTTKAPKLTKAIKKNPNPKSNPEIKPNFLDFANRKRREQEFMIYDEGNYDIA